MVVRVKVNTALVEEARIRGSHATRKAAAIATLTEYIDFMKRQKRYLAQYREQSKRDTAKRRKRRRKA